MSAKKTSPIQITGEQLRNYALTYANQFTKRQTTDKLDMWLTANMNPVYYANAVQQLEMEELACNVVRLFAPEYLYEEFKKINFIN